jgi:NhaP-type Na+/H+ or K+/H+ antiporter
MALLGSFSEYLHLSGLMAIFFCGLMMGHYTWYVLLSRREMTDLLCGFYLSELDCM